MKRVIYSIQGNIGSGKSTLLKAVMNAMNKVTTIPEPVQNWQHVGGYNLLDKYYQDSVRWGYTFQVNCILSRMTQLSKCIDTMKRDKIYISQRSVQSDKFIFAKLMHKLKKINDMEYSLYLQMFESLENLFNKHSFNNESISKLSLINSNKNIAFQQQNMRIEQGKSPIVYRHIYLKTSPQRCFQRIKKRNRFQQKNLQFQYINQLHNLHDEWLIKDEIGRRQSLVIDGQRQFQTDKVYLNELIQQIKSYIIESSQLGSQIQFDRPLNKSVNQDNQENIKRYAN